MQVLVRVVRAHVWLSGSVVRRQEGFLALVRVISSPSTQTQVNYGSLDDTSVQIDRRWTTVAVKWNEPSTQGSSRVVVELESCPQIQIVLFAVDGGRSSSRRVDKPSQRIVYLGSATLALSEKDVDAIREANNVVFKAPIDESLGSVEIVLGQRDNLQSSAAPVVSDEEQGSGQGSFSVHWTSSAALERDIKKKELARQEADATLIDRLVQVESKTKRVAELRGQAVNLLRCRRAATLIQRAYRDLRRRRRDERRRRRQEAEEAERQKKAVLRARIAARNEIRTKRLIEEWTKPLRDREIETLVQQQDEETAVRSDTSEMGTWIRDRETATRSRLEETLVRLKAEKELNMVETRMTRPGRRHQLERVSSDTAVGADLIYAIQRLHLHSQ